MKPFFGSHGYCQLLKSAPQFCVLHTSLSAQTCSCVSLDKDVQLPTRRSQCYKYKLMFADTRSIALLSILVFLNFIPVYLWNKVFFLKQLKFTPPVTLVSDPIIRNLKKSSRLELFIALLNNLWTIAMHWSVTDGPSDILTWRYLFFWFRNYSAWQGLNPKIK